MANWEHIKRKIVKIERTNSDVLIDFECGHQGRFSLLFCYDKETHQDCFSCAKERFDRLTLEGK